jgi:seryl-tRNA synthetase
MDEIITRWVADLSKYQKEFQSQAETVAQWDRALVENSDKVRQLYSKTFQAERDAAEVERQLTMMEENQQELDSYLDRYEKEIENLMKMHGVSGRSDGLRGPDQEREKTYKLAEKLQDRLNELNKDLTEMIEEINTTSQTLSKTGKPDDPVRIISFAVLHAVMLTFKSLQRSSGCSIPSSRSSSLSTLALRSCKRRSTRHRRRAALLAPTDGTDWALILRMTSTGASVATGSRGTVVTHRSAGIRYDVGWMILNA